MEAVCTSEILATLPPSTWCKDPRLHFRDKIIEDKVTEQPILDYCISTKTAFMFPFLPLKIQNRISGTVNCYIISPC
jgi:hypothetical protein